ncbi:MAG: hypothetical protein NZM04_02685, partial [Methylacidiphilales bacterium]|nr:hypothetical protein [Candidatus Methylacidiphilales bacterium]
MKAQKDVFAYFICNDLGKLEELEKICKQIKGDELDIFRVVIYYMKFLYSSNEDPLKIIVALAFLTKMKDGCYDKITKPLLNERMIIQCALYISRYIRYKDPYYLDIAIPILYSIDNFTLENIIKFLLTELKKDMQFRIKLIERITEDWERYDVYSFGIYSFIAKLRILAQMGFYKNLDKIIEKAINLVSHKDEDASWSLKDILKSLDEIKDDLGTCIIKTIYKWSVINKAEKHSFISDVIKNIITSQAMKYGDFIDFDVLERNWHDPKDKSTLILALSNIVYRLRKLDASKGII